MAKFNQQRPQSEPAQQQQKQPEKVNTTPDNDVDHSVLQSQVLDNSHTPDITQSSPIEKPADEDAPTSKDHLIHDSTYRRGGKRRFMTDILCRSLDCEHYVGNAEKRWVHNPLGGMPAMMTFTREFPTKFILFDHFDSAMDPKVIGLKRDACHKHGYIYLFETPEKLLDHAELHRQLDEQKDIKPPKQVE